MMGNKNEPWEWEDMLIGTSDQETLEEARQNYGYKNQVSVANEELKELAILCDKYMRYEKHETAVEKLKDQIIDEYADVIVVLNHLKKIFGLTDQELRERVCLKIDRLRRWMEENPSFEHTTVDREVRSNLFQDHKELEYKLVAKCSGCDGCNKDRFCDPNCTGVEYLKQSIRRTLIDGEGEPERDMNEVPCSPTCYGWEHLEECAKCNYTRKSPDEIQNKISELCGGCTHGSCKDEHGFCLKYERRQFLDETLDRALSRL